MRRDGSYVMSKALKVTSTDRVARKTIAVYNARFGMVDYELHHVD